MVLLSLPAADEPRLPLFAKPRGVNPGDLLSATGNLIAHQMDEKLVQNASAHRTGEEDGRR